eukprot:Tbor_TRINITY_DN5457_c1_g6::TRINITY_DN5457_c1_g6_i1::g.24097::m.24097/K03097/CSNK2A; casein kinase II subunit alpha
MPPKENPPPETGHLHPHALVSQYMPQEFWNYETSTLDWGKVDPYEVMQKIGRGKYSEVFRGRNRDNNQMCVIKVLKPVKSHKIVREITILQHLFGAPNVIRLLDIAFEPVTEIPVLIFENVNAVEFRTLFPLLTPLDIRYYIFQILKTLDYVHSLGIMHRDLKPQNLVIDHQNRKLRVIDWGLGEYYLHRTPYNVRVASRYFKGPELLIGYRYYDYSLDIWSLGCILGGLMFRKDPLFPGSDNNDQLARIVSVLGSEGLKEYIDKYKPIFPKDFDHCVLELNKPKRPWASLVTSLTASRCDPHALDLLDRMMRYDHEERILPRDAMLHPYFDPVREECMMEDNKLMELYKSTPHSNNNIQTLSQEGISDPTDN